jgi:hypothetical protein
VSQVGSLIVGGGGGREGDVVRTGVGAVGAVMDDGLEASLGSILGMVGLTAECCRVRVEREGMTIGGGIYRYI